MLRSVDESEFQSSKILCRCCLSKDPENNLRMSYTNIDKTEVYSDMINDCFGIEFIFDEQENDDGICDNCVTRLRDACDFKYQVEKSQNQFAISPVMVEVETVENNIKIEQIERDNDCFIIDAKSEGMDSDYEEIDVNNMLLNPKSIVGEKNQVLTNLLKLNQMKIKKDEYIKKYARGKVGNVPNIFDLNITGKKVKSASSTSNKSTNIEKSAVKIKRASSHKPNSREMFAVRISPSTKLFFNLESPDRNKFQKNIKNLVKYSNCTPFTNRTIHGYTCAFCNDICRTIQELRDHVNSKHKKDPNTKYTGERDRSLKMEISNLKCDLCSVAVNNIKEMKTHLKEHEIEMFEDVVDYIIEFKFDNDKDFDCITCGSSFETYRTLLKHMNKHYRNFVCDVCETGFINTIRLRRHKKCHEKGEHKCRFCGKIFDTFVKRDNHEKVHKGIKTKCCHCDETFNNYFRRNKHMKTVHNDLPGNYTCNICNKQFLLSGQLSSHIRKYHLMEKNHRCSFCDMSFFQKRDLEKHMVKHTGERNFKCRFCGKAYGRKRTLVEHERIHTNDRRYKCPICGAAFVQKCSMKGHMLSNHSISLAEYELANKTVAEDTEVDPIKE